MNSIDLADRVIFEDNHLLVVDKLAGELVQGDATGDLDILIHAKQYIAKTYNKPGKVFVGLPHRLDRPTSGVVVLCRTSKALTRIAEQFRNRVPRKTYHCLVEGKLENTRGDLIHFLKKDGRTNKSYLCHEPNGKRAHLSYKVLTDYDRYALLEIDLHTGRHHQIRAQLAAIGHPIKGDLKYGAKRSNKDGQLCLHAYRLSLLHPTTKEEVSFYSKMDFLTNWGFKH